MSADPGGLFAAPAVSVTRRPDGSQLVRSELALRPYSRAVGEWLLRWAGDAPDRIFLAERQQGGWRQLAYGEALAQVRSLATWMLDQGLGADRPLMILSDNSIEHALLTLAAMQVGVPAVPVSPAYSLLSQDYGKLKAIVRTIAPGAIFVAPAGRFATALAAIAGIHDARIIAGAEESIPDAISYRELLATTDAARVDRAFATVGPDTIAKILFTSGSTGLPKGVINTQRMLCASQQAKLQVWPFLAQTPPVIVDWLPWNHTFGGNHNFNMVLRNGGTLYIDAGKAAPGLFDKTLENLREISPTIYFNVPRGYDFLVGALANDRALRDRFFERLQIIFYAAAALPQHLWEALERLSQQTLGRPVPMVAAWGSTETAPLATDCHFQAKQSGVIGLPVPGCELKLVPAGDKLEIRVRGANVTPGYWRQPDLTAAAFDEEGYYRIGDAVRWLDDRKPEAGLLFDGRIAEDFKLSSGTWVSVGSLRVQLLAALAPVAQDIVVCGHDRDDVRLLVFPNVAACRELAGLTPQAPLDAALGSQAVRQVVADGLRRLRDEVRGTSTCAAAALLLTEPPSIDAGEITDKGYINQGEVLARRSTLAASLYRSPLPAAVITP